MLFTNPHRSYKDIFMFIARQQLAASSYRILLPTRPIRQPMVAMIEYFINQVASR
jgi:hypothetical protein